MIKGSCQGDGSPDTLFEQYGWIASVIQPYCSNFLCCEVCGSHVSLTVFRLSSPPSMSQILNVMSPAAPFFGST